MNISENYKDMTDSINDAQERGSLITSFVDQMRTELNNSEIPSTDTNKEKLESNIIVTSNRLSEENVIYTPKMLEFVRVLQKYITDEYGSVDVFLSNNKIKVKSTFADISEDTGYSILPSNISNVS